MQPTPNFLLMLLSIATTGICWGIYGPILHWGQGEMGGRWRTFICVGLAYFIVAVIAPVIFMSLTRDEIGEGYKTNTPGVIWSLLGGALGAVGALGIILAFKYSSFGPNTPLIVMPLVFGTAPVFNTLFQLYMNRNSGLSAPNPIFYAGLILVVAGAVTVLIFAPKPDRKAHARKMQEKAEAAEVASMKRESPLSASASANAKLQEELDLAKEAENKTAEENEPTQS